jgi:hypothetical protein
MAFEQMRAFRAGQSQQELGPVEHLDPDRYPLLACSELRAEHAAISEFLRSLGTANFHGEIPKSNILDQLLHADERIRTRHYLALIERTFAYDAGLSVSDVNDLRFSGFFGYGSVAKIMAQIFKAGVECETVATATLEWFNCYRFNYYGTPAVDCAVEWIKGRFANEPLPEPFRRQLIALRGQASDIEEHYGGMYSHALLQYVDSLIGDGPWNVLVPCERWTHDALEELLLLTPTERDSWFELVRHCQSATTARPSAKWLKTGTTLRKAIGDRAVAHRLLKWLPKVDAGRLFPLAGMSWENVDEQQRMHEINATTLRGLVWLSADIADADLMRAIGQLAVSCYRKIRGLGPRAVKVGNAAVYALSQMKSTDAVGQLAILQAKIKFGTALKEVEKAFNAAATALNIPRNDLEEMAIPSYGLTAVGLREEKIGDCVGRLTVAGADNIELVWVKSDGKPKSALPAAIKKNYSGDIKELKAAAKDIERMLPAQRERIDSLFLRQKAWTFPIWRERYLDHPLVGVLARRLLWDFTIGKQTCTGIWFDGRLVDLDLKPVEALGPDMTIRLWHPIDRSTEEIVAWRSWLDAQHIQQPFKQAHREIYVLTDAERTTGVYSNRYAAHVLRQHQFNALCALRGWKNKLRLLVDNEYPPASLTLPQWNLRAEFWIEGIGANYGTDTNDSGVFLHVSTDQVRFYHTEAAQARAHAGGGGYRLAGDEPVSLDQIPPLVFSEVMRDVDMFVGVASVGNDPTWADGGPEGRYRDYWQGVSFGDLSATAKTRKDVLQRLVPKLKVAKQCSFDEKFLIVKGSLRTYKIHLGSGNILMAPNDQYLCIVPKQTDVKMGEVFLPFEGDRTLSIILSKAFLLAADSKISDRTILQQIQTR